MVTKRTLRHQLSSVGLLCLWNSRKEMTVKECYIWTQLKTMLDTGEVLMFLCSILLTGGHTLRNGIRKSSTKLAQLWFRCKWLNIYNIKVLTITKVIDAFRWDYYKDGNKLYKAMNPMVAYERGLTTWAEWVEINLDPSKTKVIFRTSSPRSTSLSNLITLNTWKQSLIM